MARPDYRTARPTALYPVPVSEAIEIVAHRGASEEEPEHSLAAYLLAVKQGADAIECDVRLTRDGQPVAMTAQEFKILEYLMRHAGQVVTRTMLLEHVWDYHFDPQTNVVDVLVSRLRDRIDKPFEAKLLRTVRGVGYRLGDPQ